MSGFVSAGVPDEREAHLWFVRPETMAAESDLQSCRRCLTVEELEAIGRFHFAKDRHDRLIARALLRTVLSTYVDVDPAAWRFEPNAHGRPEIAQPASGRHLKFSVSHTSGLIVCLVAFNRVVGVDAEPLQQSRTVDEIASRYFAPAEVAELNTWPPPIRHERFVEYWTLKEAYVKAVGLGLSIPLRHFAFQIHDAPLAIGISFEPEIDDDPRRWQFELERVGDSHIVAAAMEQRPGSKILWKSWQLGGRLETA